MAGGENMQDIKTISGIDSAAVPATASSIPASGKAVNGKYTPSKPLNTDW